jgi:integrase
MSNLSTTNSSLTTERSRLEAKTLVELLDEFLATKKSSQTKKAYQQDILAFFEGINVHNVQDLLVIPLYELSRVVLLYTESFKKAEEYHIDRVSNPRTINRKAYALSSFFEFLVATYGYPRNPVKVFVPYSTPQQTSTDALEQSELEAMRTTVREKFATAESQKAKIFALQQLLIMGCMMLSMRRNEVAHLRWKDLDWGTCVITVFGKGQKLKYLPLPPTLITYLHTFQDSKLSLGYVSEYIFSPLKNPSTGDLAKPITGSYLFQLIQKIAKQLQLEGKIDPDKQITPHSFRTTFVKLALERKQTDIEIMNATGHSTSAMVKYYDSRSSIDVNAARVMDDLF